MSCHLRKGYFADQIYASLLLFVVMFECGCYLLLNLGTCNTYIHK